MTILNNILISGYWLTFKFYVMKIDINDGIILVWAWVALVLRISVGDLCIVSLQSLPLLGNHLADCFSSWLLFSVQFSGSYCRLIIFYLTWSELWITDIKWQENIMSMTFNSSLLQLKLKIMSSFSIITATLCTILQKMFVYINSLCSLISLIHFPSTNLANRMVCMKQWFLMLTALLLNVLFIDINLFNKCLFIIGIVLFYNGSLYSNSESGKNIYMFLCLDQWKSSYE